MKRTATVVFWFFVMYFSLAVALGILIGIVGGTLGQTDLEIKQQAHELGRRLTGVIFGGAIGLTWYGTKTRKLPGTRVSSGN
jgi:hypothetical protein